MCSDTYVELQYNDCRLSDEFICPHLKLLLHYANLCKNKAKPHFWAKNTVFFLKRVKSKQNQVEEKEH